MLLLTFPLLSRTADEGRGVCVNNLRRIGQAYHLWAADHDERFPFEVPTWEGGLWGPSAIQPWQPFVQLGALRAYLGDPGPLACPSDAEAVRVRDFDWLAIERNRAVSYFVSHGRFGSSELLSGDGRNLTGNVGSGGCVYFGGGNRNIASQQAGWDSRVHVKQGNVLHVNGAVEQLFATQLRDLMGRAGQTNVHLGIPSWP